MLGWNTRSQVMHVLHSKFVSKRKRDENGKDCRFTACLVIHRNKKLVNLRRVSPQFPQFSSSRMLIAIFAQNDWYLRHSDAQPGFANGNLRKPVYVEFRRYI